MQKIISLFTRNYKGDRLIYDEIVKGAEWVVAGEGQATRKWDGTCCMVRDGKLFKRYEVKKGKAAPPGFEPSNDVDPQTGKQQGWRPVGDGPEDQYHREACDSHGVGSYPDGTYELCGPKVQGNPEHYDYHILIGHGVLAYPKVPTTFNELREWFKGKDYEGIVWHHPDGRMVKIKKKDFGLKREE